VLHAVPARSVQVRDETRPDRVVASRE